ncbi:MAG: nitroreductase [Oscillospiraceae bacterium]|nr:nitroreductase [Oscillospiraceae bacterium]
MENLDAIVKARRSVRSYDGSGLTQDEIQKLTAFMAEAENPYGIDVKFKLLDAAAHGLSSPVITGEKLYVGAKVKAEGDYSVAYGYSFEAMVLYAQSLDIGTVWIGGTMDRAAFKNCMELKEGELMPCVSPLGKAAKKMSLRETMMRKTIKADSRMDFGELFFDGDFNKAITPEKAGELCRSLEMVRLAPSAVNKQPWRVVVRDGSAYFYLKRSKGFGAGALDMQRIDMGIALCHFDLAAKEKGLKLSFEVKDPGIAANNGEEYIASYVKA